MSTTSTTTTRRQLRRSQTGASLIIVLFLVAFLSIIVPAVVGLVYSGATTTTASNDNRRTTYAANSALEASVQYGRTARWVGRVGTYCPTLTTTVDGVTAIVTCTSTTGPFDLDRSIQYAAAVGSVTVAKASVIYRDGTAGSGEPTVDVASWSSNLLP